MSIEIKNKISRQDFILKLINFFLEKWYIKKLVDLRKKY